ncbi:hypothetical protein T459_21854 [Capsicum annuum]|uniref:Uncharacterized protein n=1 Tax=Capsicum annuum TaxID=4072 RepID=A0A2G2YXU5_CAPAN|nr:hypothetical protein T459_21854 [Capsicum annuum]
MGVEEVKQSISRSKNSTQVISEVAAASACRHLILSLPKTQGLVGYKSVSYKDFCKFPGVNLPPGFKMLKFENYDGHGDPVAHMRSCCNQLRDAGGKEELLMAYFGESLSGLASEWFVDQDIDK